MRYYALFSALLLATSVHSSSWHSEITPYIWASGLKGDVQIANRQVAVDESFIDLMKQLKFGAMLWAQTHNDQVGFFLMAYTLRLLTRK